MEDVFSSSLALAKKEAAAIAVPLSFISCRYTVAHILDFHLSYVITYDIS